MKVIVTITPTSTTINEDLHEDWVDDGVDIKVRKCPPNYEPLTSSKWYELIVEVDDYSEEDIKEYFEKPGIEWRGWKKKKLKKLEKQGASESEIKHWKDKHKDPVK